MAPWESDTEAGSSGSGSDDDCTPTSGPGDVGAQSPQKMSFKTWKQEFFDRLGEIKTFGDFACMTRYSHHINPGLEVAGSLIPLPLVTRDADTIKGKCEQAPFGRGDDTVVDESVRKTWQLDSSLFRCSNPAWSAFLDTVLQGAVQKLGMYVLEIRTQHRVSSSLNPTYLMLYQAERHPSSALETATLRRWLVLQASQGL